VLTLFFSRRLNVRFVERQDLPHLFDCHVRVFDFFSNSVLNPALLNNADP